MSAIKIDAPIEPVPFQRTYIDDTYKQRNPVRYREFKETLGWYALAAMQGRAPLTGSVIVRIKIYKQKPRKVTSRNYGDVDNHAKAVLDALNGICYVDDRQVVRVEAGKYHGASRLEIRVEEIR